MTVRVDVAVIGRGMIGSAAARHLAEAAVSVALVGADEPADWTKPIVPFASHYDEARITRISAADPIWADLAARAIERYGDIEERSGIMFHQPRGLVQSALDAPKAVASAEARGGTARLVEHGWVRETTGIDMPVSKNLQLFYEDPPAGVISPRRLVAAQTTLAVLAGATLVEHAATQVRSTARGISITVGAGEIEADRVVLATGAYGADLVGVHLAIERRLRTVLMAELVSTPRVDGLPCLILEQPDQPSLERLYWTPPVTYPNGRSFLKIGASTGATALAETDQDIAAWFAHGGSAQEAAELLDALGALLPEATVTSSQHKPCVMTYTPTEHPYVGFIDDNVVVALGGNGSGAKSSDEIGRLAAVAVAPDHSRREPAQTSASSTDLFSPIVQVT